MFEVGKLCDESLDSFLGELEKVSLLDAEGEGEVSRYFAHAVRKISHISFTCLLIIEIFPLMLIEILFLFVGDFTFNDYRIAKRS